MNKMEEYTKLAMCCALACVAGEEKVGVSIIGTKPSGFPRGELLSVGTNAALRHLLAFIDGETLDPETGLPHLAHVRCCAAFLLTYAAQNLGHDDRHTNKTGDGNAIEDVPTRDGCIGIRV